MDACLPKGDGRRYSGSLPNLTNILHGNPFGKHRQVERSHAGFYGELRIKRYLVLACR
jgi:hypothetical protein